MQKKNVWLTKDSKRFLGILLAYPQLNVRIDIGNSPFLSFVDFFANSNKTLDS